MELIMNLLRAALIGLLAYGICRWGAARDISWLRLRGRINRLLFIVLYVLLSIIMYSFNALTLTMMDAIVTLPAYWAVRGFIFLGLVITTPLFFVLYGRRFQDFSIPGIFGILWALFIVFTSSYGVVKSTIFVYHSIIFIINLILALIPGTNGRNPYGPKMIWPAGRQAGKKKKLPARRRRLPAQTRQAGVSRRQSQ